jgi:general secretion pathway protein L
MMLERRILGIDVGTSSIKLAQLVVTPTGKQHLERLAYCATLEELSQLLDDKDWWKPEDHLHMSFPADRTVIRKIHLPFKNRQKIQQTLLFQLEGEVPFAVEEMVAGYLTRDIGSDGTTLFTLASTRDSVAAWLERFRPLGLDPVVLEPDIAALSHLVPRAIADPPESFVVVDLGASKTNLLFYHGDTLEALRTIRRGLGEGTAVPPVPDNLIQDIQRTFTALKARGEAPLPGALYLCGGGTAAAGLSEWLERRLGVRVQPFKPVAALPNHVQAMPEQPDSLFSVAVALALRHGKRADGSCNLRAGELAYRPGLSLLRGRPLVAAALIGLVLLLGMGDLYARYAVRRHILEDLRSETRTLFKKAFPEVSTIVDPALQMRRLLDERRNSQLNLLARDPRGFAVELLREISIKVQTSTRLRLTQFDFNADTITIRGEADGYNTIENAKVRWQTSPLLEDVEIKTAKKNPKTQLWEFQCIARRKYS